MFLLFRSKQPRGKPWHCNRVKSSELIAGKMIKFCACCKKNGLQDDCHRTQCQGKPWCMYEPLPKCPPFTQIPGRYVPPDPLELVLYSLFIYLFIYLQYFKYIILEIKTKRNLQRLPRKAMVKITRIWCLPKDDKTKRKSTTWRLCPRWCETSTMSVQLKMIHTHIQIGNTYTNSFYYLIAFIAFL